MAPHRLFGTSVGRKALMAVSGLLLCGFLLIHLIGNITLLIADDGALTAEVGAADAGEHFMGVVGTYGAIPALLFLLEVALGALLLGHIVLGLTLWFQNYRARGRERYVLKRKEGGRTLGSYTMVATGPFVIGTFLVVHLLHFRFGPQENPQQMYSLVGEVLTQWPWALAYGVALLGLLLHLSHGFQSAFQSLGFRHPRHTPRLKLLGWAFALLVLAGFGVLPLLYLLQGVRA